MGEQLLLRLQALKLAHLIRKQLILLLVLSNKGFEVLQKILHTQIDFFKERLVPAVRFSK